MKKIIIIIILTGLLGLDSFVQAANRSSFFLSPESGTYQVGSKFWITVMVNTDGAAINAASTVINFPADKLKVLEVSKVGSVFSFWPQEIVFSNSEGKISFGAGLPTPGYTGEAGTIFSIFFQAKTEGEARIYFSKESILANDARGTNIFSFSKEAVYTIIKAPEMAPLEPLEPAVKAPPPAPQIFSPTHPRENKWYSNNSPILEWEVPSGVDGVSTILTTEADYILPLASEGLISSKRFFGLGDGVWYFYARFKNKYGLGEAKRFKVQIDSQPPEDFEIIIDNEGDPTKPWPILYFEAKDELSGINHYEVRIGEGDIFSLLEVQTNPLRLPHQSPGRHSIIVKAIDNAGNSKTAQAELMVESIPSPKIRVCPGSYLAGEEILYLEGTAPAEQKVIIFLERDNKLIKQWEIESNSEGFWSLEEEDLFKSGLYKISARTKDQRGAISHPSSECILRIVLMGIGIGPLIITYRILVLVILGILLVSLVILILIIRRNRKEKEYLAVETQDLKRKFFKEYNELKEDIESQLEIVREARKGRESTKEEEIFEKRLLQNLKDVEDVLMRELSDIEEIT